jgi:hypothetical protein
MKKGVLFAFLAAGAALGSAQACGSSDSVTCGDGTVKQGSTCVAATGDAATDTGTGTVVPDFAGVTAVAPASTTSLRVSWNPATDGGAVADDVVYRVYVGTSAGQENFAAPTLETPAGARFAEVTGLTEGTQYYVVVRAHHPGGDEDANNVEKSGKPGADTKVPTFSGAVSAKPAGATSVEVSWAAGSDDLTAKEGLQYLVYVSDTPQTEGFAVPAAVSDPGATSVVVSGLENPTKPAKTYYFVVRARDASGNTDDNTTEVDSAVGPDTTAPSFGGCVLATATGATSAHLSWRAGSDDATAVSSLNYLVFASKTAGSFDFTVPQATFTGVTDGEVQGLSPKSQYYFVCRAADGWGNHDDNEFQLSAMTASDSTAPTFGGVTGATNVTTGSAELTWDAATDDQTADTDIVYDVFEALAPGGQDFTAAPTYTSDPGATSLIITGLEPRTHYYWVVRARDKANNESENTEEIDASTLVSFKANVVAGIFAVHCALTGCHSGAAPTGGMDLSVNAYSHIVSVATVTAPTGGQWSFRIAPGDLDASYMFAKISAVPCADNIGYCYGTGGVPPKINGTVMPPPSQQDPLGQAEKDTLHDWILQGALNN